METLNWPCSERRCESCTEAEREEGAKGKILLRCRCIGAGRRYGWMVGSEDKRNPAPAWCPKD